MNSKLAAALCLTALVAVTVASPVGGPTTALDIRSPGTVAEHVDQEDLVKRVNLAVFGASLSALGAITYTACNANVPAVVQGIVCFLSVTGALAGAMTGLLLSFVTRDEMDPRDVRAMMHYFPAVKGLPTMRQLEGNYTGTPLLVAHSPCEYAGCHNVHYTNRIDPRGRTVHQMRASPRYDTSGKFITSLPKKHQRRQEENQDANDGGLFGHYEFYDDNKSDEGAIGQDSNFPTELENAVNNEMYSQQGAYCFNIEDNDDGGNYATGGFLVAQQDSITIPNQPGEDQGWLDQCNNEH